VPGPVDPTPVLEYVAAAAGSTTKTNRITSGKPQES
jgi:hypothetical protein